jgi:hypothetical protein
LDERPWPRFSWRIQPSVEPSAYTSGSIAIDTCTASRSNRAMAWEHVLLQHVGHVKTRIRLRRALEESAGVPRFHLLKSLFLLLEV